jgi:hypothetical protein
MKDYCKEKEKVTGNPDITDDNCSVCPSLRSEDDYTDLCPYAALWKYFQLTSRVTYKS